MNSTPQHIWRLVYKETGAPSSCCTTLEDAQDRLAVDSRPHLFTIRRWDINTQQWVDAPKRSWELTDHDSPSPTRHDNTPGDEQIMICVTHDIDLHITTPDPPPPETCGETTEPTEKLAEETLTQMETDARMWADEYMAQFPNATPDIRSLTAWFTNTIEATRTADQACNNRSTPPVHDFGEGQVHAHRHINPGGTEGGWVADTANVADTATIGPNAQISDNARVFDHAQVLGDAQVYCNAQVYNNATVDGSAWVSGNARVFGDARVYDSAVVYGNAQVFGDARICKNAHVIGNVATGETTT